jgi:alpha-amylase
MSTQSHRTPESEKVELSGKIAEILRTVSHEKGFHFNTAPGSFTGETATSLDDFEKKLQIAPAESVNFHLQRGDFQKWFADTLGDTELAKMVSQIKLTFPVEDLRKELLKIVKTRLTELWLKLPQHSKHHPS